MPGISNWTRKGENHFRIILLDRLIKLVSNLLNLSGDYPQKFCRHPNSERTLLEIIIRVRITIIIVIIIIITIITIIILIIGRILESQGCKDEQTERIRRLILVSFGSTCQKERFVTLMLNYYQ